MTFAAPLRPAAALAILALAIAPAQTPTGNLIGIVTDPSDSLVAGATVTIRNVHTNFTQAVTTGADGLYRFPALSLGTYEVSVQAPGFQRFVRSGIEIQVAESARADAQLGVGEVSATVQVSSNTLAVDTESSALRGVVDSKSISELPLNGRDVTRLVLLVPGTVDAPTGPYQQAFDIPGRSAIPAGGGRGNMVNYSLDGSNSNDNYTNVNNPLPNPDAIQEIVVQTNAFSARYGQSGGAAVNVITRSGTNSLHGSAFEYLRNTDLNAENVLSGKTDGLKRNQFGFSLGGPVLIPKLYDGRNKTFFLTSYQGTKVSSLPTSSTAILPTTAERSGDFSGISTKIVDPITNQPFPGNIIPASRLGTLAQKAFQYLPVPASLPNQPAGTIFVVSPNQQNLSEFLIKVDHQTASKNLLSVRYFVSNYDQPPYWADNLVSLVVPVTYRYQTAAINDTTTFHPNLINQFIFSYDRTQMHKYLAADLGINKDFGMNVYAPNPSMVIWSVSGYFSVNTGQPEDNPRNNFQWSDNVNYVHGSHQFTFGGTISRVQMSMDNTGGISGNTSYNGSRSGNQLADFVLGLPSGFTQSSGLFFHMRGSLYGFYGQDDWKVSRRFTLNLGLRYEPFFPMYEKQNMGGTFLPGYQSTTYPNAPRGIRYYGDPGEPRGHQQDDLNNLAPRIGFAWDPFGHQNFSIRGGYGIFYDISPTKTYVGFPSLPPFTETVSLINPPSDSNPLQLVGNPFPYTFSASSPTTLPATVSVRNPSRRTAYVQSWNLTLERKFGASLLGRGSYVGSKGTKLETYYEGNPAIYIPGQSTTSNTNSRRPLIGDGLASVGVSSNEGLSIYHAMQLSLEARVHSWLVLTTSYTYSKSIDNISIANGTSPIFVDPFNKNAYRGVSDFDVPQRFVAGYVWYLPTVKPHNGFARTLLGAWSTSGIFEAQSGLPLILTAGVDRSLSGVGADYVDIIGNPHVSVQDFSHWFNTGAFAQPALGTFGDLGRNVLRGAGINNLDFSIAKDFPFHEGYKLQFRTEFFNGLNHVNPGAPTTTFTSPNFGRITSYAGPRTLQMSLRFNF
jgi:hypothetical protein